MNKLKTRLISSLLTAGAAIFTVSLYQVPSHAVGFHPDKDGQYVYIEEEKELFGEVFEDWTYKELNADEIEITGYTGTSNVIEIPEQIYGRTVTKIGDEAFYGCSKLEEIVIPDSVTSIGKAAFRQCKSLKRISLPAGLTVLSNSAFYSCSSLECITIPAATNSIGENAFRSCANLKTVNISGNHLNSIGKYAFGECKSLSEIKLPDSVTNIFAYAFYGCAAMKSINIPVNLKVIPQYAFRGCTNLMSVNIPSGVTDIQEAAFQNCKSFTSLYIPSGVVNIGPLAFDGCEGLTNIRVDSNNKYYTAEGGVLYNKSKTELILCLMNNETVTIPGSVKVIAKRAFAGCRLIAKVSIPDSVKSIGERAFAGCLKLNSIKLPAGIKVIEPGTFQTCTSLGEVVIPNGVTTIGADTFAFCSMLKKVTIPNSVNGIAESAFDVREGFTIVGYDGTRAESFAREKEFEFESLDIYATSIKLSAAQATMTKGSKKTVKATVYPANVTNKAVKWTSNNIRVATVDQKGRITAVGYGTAVITATTQDRVAKKASVTVTVPKKKITSVTLKYKKTSYNGKSRKPSVTVKYGKAVLKKGVDYTLSYSNNKKIGTAKVVVKGKGSYTGTITKTFNINPKKQTNVSITAIKNGFTVKWTKMKKSLATGYQIRYATEKSGLKTAEKIRIRSYNKSSETIENLNGGQKYYVQVRTYKKVNGKNYYGAWSKVKYVTTTQ